MTSFPWYDSPWLATYVQARTWIARTHPERLAEFEERLAPLRTDPAFEIKQIAQVFDEDTLQKIRDTIQDLKPAQLELDELRNFGRFIVRGHPYFSELQRSLVEMVGEAVGESVEPRYNFLSLYTKAGVCGVHMDAPLAKWTLDVCIDQTTDWPLHFSQIVPWPEETNYSGPSWPDNIKRDPNLRFTSHNLRPGSALVFSGSSQWHYRDPLPRGNGTGRFCNLLFFHYIPRGMTELLKPRSWPLLFDLPALANITDRYDPDPI